jgi:CHASE2 domain-containing sensor protein
VKRLLRNPTCRGAMVGIVCALFCWGLNWSALVRGLENWALDSSILFRGQRSSQARVVIVAIDDQSLQTLGKPPVFISPEMAKVVTYLHQQGAASVGLDFMIPDSTQTIADLMPGGQGSAELMGSWTATRTAEGCSATAASSSATLTALRV